MITRHARCCHSARACCQLPPSLPLRIALVAPRVVRDIAARDRRARLLIAGEHRPLCLQSASIAFAVTDRRPRCPPWRLSNQNMVACVAERAFGLLPVCTCPSCVVHRVRDQPAWEKFVVRVAIARPKWGEKNSFANFADFLIEASWTRREESKTALIVSA